MISSIVWRKKTHDHISGFHKIWNGQEFWRILGLNNIYSDKVHDIHKYNVKIVGSDSKPVAYLDHLLDML